MHKIDVAFSLKKKQQKSPNKLDRNEIDYNK